MLTITVKHLKSDLDSKAQTIRRQNEEMEQLRDTILQLQRDNAALRQRSHSPQQEERSYYDETEREASPS